MGLAPLWDPFAALGRQLAADPVVGMFYPLNCALRLLPQPLSLNLSIALHHYVAAAGAFLLLLLVRPKMRTRGQNLG